MLAKLNQFVSKTQSTCHQNTPRVRGGTCAQSFDCAADQERTVLVAIEIPDLAETWASHDYPAVLRMVHIVSHVFLIILSTVFLFLVLGTDITTSFVVPPLHSLSVHVPFACQPCCPLVLSSFSSRFLPFSSRSSSHRSLSLRPFVRPASFFRSSPCTSHLRGCHRWCCVASE